MGFDLNFDKNKFLITGIDYIVLHTSLSVIRLPLNQRRRLLACSANQQQFTVGLRHNHVIPAMPMPARLSPRGKLIFGDSIAGIVDLNTRSRWRTLI